MLILKFFFFTLFTTRRERYIGLSRFAINTAMSCLVYYRSCDISQDGSSTREIYNLNAFKRLKLSFR